MTARLITTYQEAKALKAAGWPQTVMNASHYYDTNVEDDPRGPYQSGGRFTDNHPAYLSAPRLDELLALLWERGREPVISVIDGMAYVDYATGGRDDERHTERREDRLAAIVATVLHILNSERTPSSPPQH